MSDEVVRVRVWASTNKVGSECEDIVEFDATEWAGATEEEREEWCREAAFEYIEWGYEVQE